MSLRHFVLGLSLVWGVSDITCQAGDLVPNASFEDGDTGPVGWTLNRGEGTVISPGALGRRAISVSGDGASDNAWMTEPLRLAPNTVYRLRFQSRRVQGTGGLPTSGPLFCNRDLSSLGSAWTRFDSYFVTPVSLDEAISRIRFGQWKVAGQVAFDDVQLDRVIPIYRTQDGLQLGAGEVIRGRNYTFRAPYGQSSANQSRPLDRHRCSFNSNRWQLSGPDAMVLYRHNVGRLQQRASVHVGVGWYAHGQLVVAASRDGEQWRQIGTLGESGAATFRIPDELLPAESVWVRLTVEKKAGESSGPSLQVNEYGFDATLDGEPMDLVGATRFVAVTREDLQVDVTILDIGDAVPGGKNEVALRLSNKASLPIKVLPQVSVLKLSDEQHSKEVAQIATRNRQVVIPGHSEAIVRLPYQFVGVRSHRLVVTLAGDVAFTAEATIDVPSLYAAHYGVALPASTGAVGLWGCSSGWKVSAKRPVPADRADALVVEAAANEAEAVQLVVRPENGLLDFTVAVSDIVASAELDPMARPSTRRASIPADCVDVLRVRYVQVSQPTDASSTVGLWPDPLPPLAVKSELLPNRNFPLWIRVRVPKGTPAGIYKGHIHLQAQGYDSKVPLHVTVFGFELPDRMTCQTAFGLNTSSIERYHRLKTMQQKRQVFDKYLRCLSDHHISPYNPAPYDPITVTWQNLSPWLAGQRDEQVFHDGLVSLRVADRSATENSAAHYRDQIPVDNDGLKLRFWYKTQQAGHRFIVTLRHFDQAGKWMSGRNNDITVTGDGSWQHFERTITRFPESATTVQLSLWATSWRDDGSLIGTVWYDDVSLVDLSTGKERIRDGSFEANEQPVPTPVFDFAGWDRAMTRAVEHHHFNTFRLNLPGLGGGTFHARYEPELQGFSEDTEQYQGAMQAYLGGLETHLRDKGWLDEAFVYWFDEPDPKDYAFVMNGFSKLKRWSPGLRRMLTEQVEPALVGGPNIWCPVTSSHNHDDAQLRRQQGDAFWWYVCTGPKAPYCTLFIDHPGTEMRVWLWQTWQRDITGILVWASNYWTSSAAYPEPGQPQNPYLDPMGWVSGYSTPRGTRRAWGNGDGRFLYPPETAADGRPERAVIDAPVASIRLEMLRDGIEDYEYLVTLSHLVEKRQSELPSADVARYRGLLTVPVEITKDMTHFTTDPATIERRRQEVARAIERLTNK